MRRESVRSSHKTRKNSIQTSGAMQSKRASSRSANGAAAGRGGLLTKAEAMGESSGSSSVEWTTECESSSSSSSSSARSPYYVREVWASDVEHELRLMEKLVEDYPYVAVDGRFPGLIARPTGPFKDDTERNYEIIRTNMGLVKMIQLSLAFSNKDGVVAGHPEDVRASHGSQRPPPSCVWKINFHFDVREDMYCADALEQLRAPVEQGGAGIDLNAHLRRGVSVDRFSELITGSGLVMSPDVTWITVGGGFLFAGLVRMLSGQALPKTEEEFSETCYEYFPHIWDMRVFRRCSARCGMPPRVPLHACSSERSILAACGSDLETSPTLALTDAFFRSGGGMTGMKSSSDDASVSSSVLRSDSDAVDAVTGRRRASVGRWRAERQARRPSQFGLWELSALNMESPAQTWRGKGVDVISRRVKLRSVIEAEYEQAESSSIGGGSPASRQGSLPVEEKQQPNGVVPPPPPPPPPGPPPPLDAHSTSGSNTSPSDRQEEVPRHKHPLRHPKYPNGAPPPMCGAISYKGPPIAARKFAGSSMKRGQPFMHWGCVQLPERSKRAVGEVERTLVLEGVTEVPGADVAALYFAMCNIMMATSSKASSSFFWSLGREK
ncbi:CCR4-NOT transcription complex subunit 8 [Perkinsus olseni]|uniref:CCR4-NOT transcription complex subunit 8 n=1 Tax=Perkinsus olseni TaxID=32597 RepID=A0A7J6R9R7_PEROL|nr:CCR4-NOT transcription complex subunit 8 [Perkinsus olseni]